MLRFELTIRPPKNLGNRTSPTHKLITWPVLPRVGDELDLCEPGFAGGHTGIVTRVVHWLGVQDDTKIEVNVELERGSNESEEEAWNKFIQDGWAD